MDKLLLVGVNFADDREQTYSYVALVIAISTDNLEADYPGHGWSLHFSAALPLVLYCDNRGVISHLMAILLSCCFQRNKSKLI